MLDALLRFSLKNRLAPFVLAVALGAAGWWAWSRLTVEAFPDPTDTQVQVITIFPGQPTEEVERRVSLPIERVLNGTPALSDLRSVSMFGLSFVTCTFDDSIDVIRARNDVKERLSDADLPNGVQPDLGPLYTPIGEVYRYTLEGADPMTLRTLQDWIVEPALRQVAGVADVVSYGGLVREVHVEPHPVRMAQLGVSLEDVFQALQKGSANASGGTVERGSEMFVIRSLGVFADADDIRKVRVAWHAGRAVTIGDVASVVPDAYAPRQGVVTRDRDEDTVEGIVLMRRGENPSVVLEGVRAKVAALDFSILPGMRGDPFLKLGDANVHVHTFYDRTDLVDLTLHTVFHNLLEGALLVTLVLLVFLRSWRAALIVALVIPLSLAASFLYLELRGMSANLLSMGAVDFGIIVDGAVILVEHLFHRAGNDRFGGREPAGAIVEAAGEVARPTLFSLLIIIAAYVPIFSLQRVEGRIFAPMANTVVSALVGALIVSFTLVPVLAYFALRNATPPAESPILVRARAAYEPALRASLKRPLPVLIVAGGVFLSALLLLPRLGSEFLPALNEGALYVTFTLPGNYSLTEGRRITPRIKEILRRTPEVVGMVSQLGRPEDGTDDTLQNNLEINIQLAPMSKWRPQMHSLDDIAAEMSRNLDEIPGLDFNFSQPIRDNVAENIAGQFGQIAIKLFGDDLDELEAAAEKTKSVLAQIPGAADVGVVKSGEMPQLAVKLDRARLARWDLDLADVQDYLETAMNGHVASELWERERKFDVTVRLPQASRDDADSIKRILLPLKDGSTIPLAAIADVKMSLGRAAITREGGRRYVGVRTNVRGRDLGSFVAEAQSKVAAAGIIPADVQVTWGGEFENQQRAMKRLEIVIPLALLLTFLLLFTAFGSLWDAGVILLNVPVALTGGVFALAAAGLTLSVSAAVGFIALLGQAVLNGVLVIAAIKARRAKGESLEDACLGGGVDRLRAILMTALLASLGLVPAALSHAIGSETQRPIAVVVVGGTLSAAALTLFVLPVTWYGLTRIREWATTGRRASADVGYRTSP